MNKYKSAVDTSDNLITKSAQNSRIEELKDDMKSPEFGQVECQMKKKEIMGPSDPIETYQMSNYKSPCVCEECI